MVCAFVCVCVCVCSWCMCATVTIYRAPRHLSCVTPLAHIGYTVGWRRAELYTLVTGGHAPTVWRSQYTIRMEHVYAFVCNSVPLCASVGRPVIACMCVVCTCVYVCVSFRFAISFQLLCNTRSAQWISYWWLAGLTGCGGLRKCVLRTSYFPKKRAYLPPAAISDVVYTRGATHTSIGGRPRANELSLDMAHQIGLIPIRLLPMVPHFLDALPRNMLKVTHACRYNVWCCAEWMYMVFDR